MFLRTLLSDFHRDEGGHVAAVSLDSVASVGAVLLAVGAATGEDVITIIGGIVLAAGLAAAPVFRHISIDYSIFERLNALEKGRLTRRALVAGARSMAHEVCHANRCRGHDTDDHHCQ